MCHLRPTLRSSAHTHRSSRGRPQRFALRVPLLLMACLAAASCSTASGTPGLDRSPKSPKSPKTPALLARAIRASANAPFYRLTGREIVSAPSHLSGQFIIVDSVVFHSIGIRGGRGVVLSAKFTLAGGRRVAAPWFFNARIGHTLLYRVGLGAWRCGAYLPDGFFAVVGGLPPLPPMAFDNPVIRRAGAGRRRVEFEASSRVSLQGARAGSSERFSVDPRGPFVTGYAETWADRDILERVTQSIAYGARGPDVPRTSACAGTPRNVWRPGMAL